MPKFNTDTLTRALDSEVADWSNRGYRVVTRTPTTAQMAKPKGSVIVLALFWLIACFAALVLWVGGAFGPTDTLFSITVVGIVFAIGLALLMILHTGLREPLVYLNIGQDGGITQG